MSSVIDRRLNADYAKVQQLVQGSGGALRLVSVKGRPPDEYVIEFNCTGIERVDNGKPVLRSQHSASITLLSNYPAEAPVARMVTPLFHPHVWTTMQICIGQWVPSESLNQLILRIGRIIQCDPELFDFKSVAHRPAADWVKENMKLFPLGRVTFVGGSAPRAGKMEWKDLG